MSKLPPPLPNNALRKNRKISIGLPKPHESKEQSLKSSPIIDASELPKELKNISNINLSNNARNSITDNKNIPQDKESLRKRNRERQIKEIIDTESVYVGYMTALRDLYLFPLRSNGLMKEKHIKIVFCDLETIINLNSKLLNSLEKAHEKFDNESTKIGPIFSSFVPFFKMYQNYCNNHENSTQILEKYKTNKNTQEFFDKQVLEPKSNGQNLQSFLIKPIQRVPRYELCLKELVKLTPKNHCDYKELQKCYNAVKQVNNEINKKMAEYESRELVKKIERRFAIGSGVSLVAPARQFIKEGKLKKVSRKKDIQYIFILFTDLLIYCSQNSAKNLKLHQKLSFDYYFRVKKVENNKKFGNQCFEIHSTTKSFLVYGEDLTDRDGWVNAIQKCLKNIRANRKVVEKKDEDDRVLETAPIWIPDDFSDRCMIPTCMKQFTWKRRRHHCRYCGRIICGDCGLNKLPHFSRNSKEYIRVGTLCFNKYKKCFPNFDPKKAHPKKRVSNFMSKPGLSTHSAQSFGIDIGDDYTDSDSESITSTSTVQFRPFTASMDSVQENKAFKKDMQLQHAQSMPNHNINPYAKSTKTALNPYKKEKPKIPFSKTRSTPQQSPVKTEVTGNFGNLNNNTDNNLLNTDKKKRRRSRHASNSSDIANSTLNVMKKKLESERNKNKQLQNKLNDLTDGNKRLRKSKVDLMTWANTEISKLKKEIEGLKKKK